MARSAKQKAASVRNLVKARAAKKAVAKYTMFHATYASRKENNRIAKMPRGELVREASDFVAKKGKWKG